MILVDYYCAACAERREVWTAGPPAQSAPCPDCGGEARRRWAPIGLGGRAAETAPAHRSPDLAPLCTKYPQVPGLCHMSESSGRMWVARYERDNRAIESELARQEARAKQKAPTMADAITHQHFAPQPKAASAAP
ncbi:MAG: Zinc ribbon domain [Pseudonocardiales bacterium]|nr:Zinc ribbon domain [Pseudonocardiales bacterium]MDT4944479.1 Zinc ribbon domain [Pseudonocardiales bacterium]